LTHDLPAGRPDAVGFVRARRPQHRDVRREAIVTAAADQLTVKRAADLTLGDIATAAGMSKSSVLRYFTSRDALLLELLARQWQEWAQEAAADLPPAGASPHEAARVLAGQAARRPVMCDLISIAPAVLEQNADPTDVVRFKTAVMASTRALASALAHRVTGLGQERAQLGADSTWVLIAGLWPLSQLRADVEEALARAGVWGAAVDFTSSLSTLTAAVLASPRT
jgi:AcrR family transcriptional regulator